MTNALIEELQAGPGSRELSDDVLLAFGWSIKPTMNRLGNIVNTWQSPAGVPTAQMDRPDPSRNLQDAVDLVAEGWEWGKYSKGGIFLHPTDSLQPTVEGGGYTDKGERMDVRLSFCIALIKARSL